MISIKYKWLNFFAIFLRFAWIFEHIRLDPSQNKTIFRCILFLYEYIVSYCIDSFIARNFFFQSNGVVYSFFSARILL